MRRLEELFRRAETACVLWIAVCFSLTSAAYLSWTYHLMEFTAPDRVDVYCLVLGYLFQGAGAALFLALTRTLPAAADGRSFCVCALIYCVFSLPALMGNTLAGALIFGFLMNGMSGVIAGYYLLAAAKLEIARRGAAFGCGYGLSTIFVFLLSLIGEGGFLRTQGVFMVYLLLAAAAAWMAFPLLGRGQHPAGTPAAFRPVPAPTLLLAGAVVFLISLVKNLGFTFASSDILAGTNLELSRLFYAVGLLAAGVICDRQRKYGAFCAIAALVLPFVMLALSRDSLPAAICWGLDYLFYGFFSVYRIVLFLDLAAQSGKWHLAALGLLMGRAGDAAGTALCLWLSSSHVLLIGVTLALFFLTLFLFLRLCQALYLPAAGREKSEREVFESFAIQHDLSAREKEVLRLVLAEQPVPQIAEALFVSESTVRYHIHNLLQKSGAKSRQELVKNYHLILYPNMLEK